MDHGELRKVVQALLEEDRMDVLWNHIVDEGHRVSSDEIRAMLANGNYTLHETVDGRYTSTFVEKHRPLGVATVFELREPLGVLEVFVLTAFHVPTKRRGRGGR